MIYKLIVNAAFLAIGYYIGKEVSRAEFARDQARKARTSTATMADRERSDEIAKTPGS